MSLIGRPVKRLEDRPLLTDSGRFAADIAVPDMLYMWVMRSPVGFGRLAGLRIAEALAHPSTVAVWTAEDVADIPPIGFRMTPALGLEPYCQSILADGHVRYVGQGGSRLAFVKEETLVSSRLSPPLLCGPESRPASLIQSDATPARQTAGSR